MRVILDTTELRNDPWLTSAPVRILQEVLQKSGAHLVVPDVVIRELGRHYERDVEKASSGARENIQTLNKLMPPGIGSHIPLPDVGGWAEVHHQRLGQRLRDLGAEQSSSAAIPATALLERAIATRRPFNGDEGKKGLRDALIWEQTLGIAATCDEPVVLVTSNRKDFAGPDGRLHADLRHDMNQRGIAPGRIEVVWGLHEFNRREADRHLGRLLDVEDALRRDTHPTMSLKAILRDHEDDIIDELDDESAKLAQRFESRASLRHRQNVRFEIKCVFIDAAEIANVIVNRLRDDLLSIGMTASFQAGGRLLSDAEWRTKHDIDDVDRVEPVCIGIEMEIELIVDSTAPDPVVFSIVSW